MFYILGAGMTPNLFHFLLFRQQNFANNLEKV